MRQITINEDVLQALEVVAEAAKKLCDKLAEVSDHPQYISVFTIAHAHGMEYKGPNYGEEAKAIVTSLDVLANAKAKIS